MTILDKITKVLITLEVAGNQVLFIVLDEDGTMVAAPHIVVRVIEQLHAFRHGFRAAACGDDRCVVFDGRVDARNFMMRNGGGDLGEFCVDRIAL